MLGVDIFRAESARLVPGEKDTPAGLLRVSLEHMALFYRVTMATTVLEPLESAVRIVHAVMPPTPQIRWPLLCARAGAEVWIKHENHTPLGAFKIRGGLVYMDELIRREPSVTGVIAATRGNHGQSVAFAAARAGLRSVIVVPHGNSREKNAAMCALGAELIEHGGDFQESF